MQTDFEKLGVFYLGRTYDLKAKKPLDELVLYDSRDLVTHAVCVGMTGSGKTGLCLSLLEEAAIDSIPVLAVDPKGDLTNLLLTFPQLSPEEFAPWVNEDEARRAGVSRDEFAAQEAEKWKKGLADWGQDGGRIQRLRDAAEFAVYTPGSQAGRRLSVLKSFAAPDEATRQDREAFQDQVGSTASSLLALLGLAVDPLKSREHILLANILSTAWAEGRDLDLEALIEQIHSPSFRKVGVMDLETFYPSKERFELALQFNNLLASPSFSSWREGEPFDAGRLLYTASGKPRVAVFYIAHLSDSERMFFVTQFFNEVLHWMRRQPGTTSLRALVYMDEIFGYFPPVANPPSKRPMLTLLKQARAFGVGLALATQNPVDLDYKGLANCGTWFIGRLQTERDKARVVEGLEGSAQAAGAPFDRGEMEKTLAALGSRVFLLHNVHDAAPTVFQVRWALSYLRGPLTREQIKLLAPKDAAAERGPAPAEEAPAPAAGRLDAGPRPVLPPDVPQFFAPLRSQPPEGARLIYRPMLMGVSQIYFSDTKAKVEETVFASYLAEVGEEAVQVDWEKAAEVGLTDEDLEREPAAASPPLFGHPASAFSRVKSFDAWKKSLVDWLYRTRKLELFSSPSLGEQSRPGESERDFRVRLQQAAREERDARAEALRQKYAPKLAAIQERIRKAEQAVQVQAEQASHSKWQSAMSFGATVLGAFLGRKKLSATTVSKAATTARSVSRTMKETGDVTRAKENVAALTEQLAALESQFQAELQELETKIDPITEPLQTRAVKPKKANISVRLMALAWMPGWQTAQEPWSAAWED